MARFNLSVRSRCYSDMLRLFIVVILINLHAHGTVFGELALGESNLCCIMVSANGTHHNFYGESACSPKPELYLNSFFITKNDTACKTGEYPEEFGKMQYVLGGYSNLSTSFCCIYMDDVGNCLRIPGTFAGCGYIYERPPVGMLRGFRIIPCQTYRNVSQCFEGNYCQ